MDTNNEQNYDEVFNQINKLEKDINSLKAFTEWEKSQENKAIQDKYKKAQNSSKSQYGEEILKNSEKKRKDLLKNEQFMNIMKDGAKSVAQMSITQNNKKIGSATAFLIGESKDCVYLATNKHVVLGANSFNANHIEKDISFHECDISMKSYSNIDILVFENIDFAIIRIPKNDIEYPDTKNYKFPIVTFSHYDIEHDDLIIKIGNTLGGGITTSFGVYLGESDALDGSMSIGDYISYDGDSGGPIMNKNGYCVGIHCGNKEIYNEHPDFIKSSILIEKIEFLKFANPGILKDLKIQIESPDEKLDIGGNLIERMQVSKSKDILK